MDPAERRVTSELERRQGCVGTVWALLTMVPPSGTALGGLTVYNGNERQHLRPYQQGVHTQ